LKDPLSATVVGLLLEIVVSWPRHFGSILGVVGRGFLLGLSQALLLVDVTRFKCRLPDGF